MQLEPSLKPEVDLGTIDKCQTNAKPRNNDRIYSHWESRGRGSEERYKEKGGESGGLAKKGRDEVQ